jgi:hypothetical protein
MKHENTFLYNCYNTQFFQCKITTQITERFFTSKSFQHDRIDTIVCITKIKEFYFFSSKKTFLNIVWLSSD